MHQKVQRWITVALFVGFLVLLPVASLALPQQATSTLEARTLAVVPDFTWGSLLSAEYLAQWESYFNDHVALRDAWLETYAFAKVRVLGEPQMNGVVVGRDGYLLPLPSYPAEYQDPKKLDALVDAAAAQMSQLDAQVKGYGGRFLFVAVPGKDSFERAYYPFWITFPPHYDDARLKLFAALSKRNIAAIDMQPVMETRRDERLYYKTDHHWTLAGAFLAYTAIADRLGLKPLGISDFNFTELPNPFIGTYNRQLGMAFPTSDHATIATPKVPIPFQKIANGDPSPELYFTEADPSKPIWYGVYMGGDFEEIVIDTNRPKLPNLLLVGDSYTNAMEPLIFLNFDQTRILDLRAYRSVSLFDYVEKHKPDVVVVLQSGQSDLSHTGNGNFGRASGTPTRPVSSQALR